MGILVTDERRVFLSFLTFGLLNNILYVVILTAAIDIVGSAVPKAVVLLADIIPALVIKGLSPFFVHHLSYTRRIWCLVFLSCFGMVLIGLTGHQAIALKTIGICMASLSSGLGEVSFLQLTHYYNEKEAIGGFSMGTGGAGICGSFAFLLMTNILKIESWLAIVLFAVLPIGFPMVFFRLLPPMTTIGQYSALHDEEDLMPSNPRTNEAPRYSSKSEWLVNHILETFDKMKPLIKPFMIPLSTVYVAEYTINQGVTPTLLFPLEELPSWLFSSYRDIYVVYGFLYQLGVFVSRSSVTFGFRFKQLYLLSALQLLNLAITLYQSTHDAPFASIWPLLLLIFYEGLLGGLSYVNTFMSVSEQSPKDQREFSMACVGISDSFGIMLAGCINWWLERYLCTAQVSRGKDWCLQG